MFNRCLASETNACSPHIIVLFLNMNLQEDLLMDVKQNLQLLGLDDDQALIFLTLYNNGSLSVVQLSRKTGFGRNKVYRLLKELMELNLINQMVVF